MTILLWILFVPLGLMAIITILDNWRTIIQRLWFKENPSLILLFGGLVGAAAMVVCPWRNLASWWFVPPLVDPGTIIGIYSLPNLWRMFNHEEEGSESIDEEKSS